MVALEAAVRESGASTHAKLTTGTQAPRAERRQQATTRSSPISPARGRPKARTTNWNGQPKIARTFAKIPATDQLVMKRFSVRVRRRALSKSTCRPAPRPSWREPRRSPFDHRAAAGRRAVAHDCQGRHPPRTGRDGPHRHPDHDAVPAPTWSAPSMILWSKERDLQRLIQGRPQMSLRVPAARRWSIPVRPQRRKLLRRTGSLSMRELTSPSTDARYRV